MVCFSSHELLMLSFGLFAVFGAQVHHTDSFFSSGFIMALVTKICKTETPVTAGNESAEMGSGG